MPSFNFRHDSGRLGRSLGPQPVAQEGSFDAHHIIVGSSVNGKPGIQSAIRDGYGAINRDFDSEIFYNWQRRHSSIGYRTPVQARMDMTTRIAA